MDVKKYQEAMASLERLHWHLHLNGGPDLWTAELLRQFQAAAKDNDRSDDEIIVLTTEPPQPAA